MKRFRFYAGLFLVAAATLMVEVIETRLLSVVAWYHLAFFVISAAMFGMTAGAVYIYLRGTRFGPHRLSYDLARYSSAFSVCTGIALAVQMTMSPETVLSASGAMSLLNVSLLMAVPFFFSGIVVSLALTRSPYPVGSVYAADLFGAALGCLGVLGLLNLTDAPSAILLSAGLAALGSVMFRGSGVGEPPPQKDSLSFLVRGAPVIFLILCVVGFINGMTDKGFQPLYVKGVREQPGKHLRAEWNSFSRIGANLPAAGSMAAIWGPSPHFAFETTPPEMIGMRIDGAAGTYMINYRGDAKEVNFLRQDITNLAYFVRNRGRSAVVGVGSGRDLLSAYLFGVRDITGVEINPIFIKFLTEDPFLSKFAGLSSLPEVRLIVDEGRSWFARTQERFDLIQMSMIDTWAATGAGAFSLSENGLYTTEAWTIFMNRLSDDGIYTVSRWFAPKNVNETGRMISLAVSALLNTHKPRPQDHIFLASVGNIATLILSKNPLGAQDVQKLHQVCGEMGYRVLLAPNAPPASELLGAIVNAADARELDRVTTGHALNLAPPTDESPFFFNQLPMGNPVKMIRLLKTSQEKGVLQGNLAASLTLVLILAVSFVLVMATLIFPLWSSTRQVQTRLIWGGSAYFILLGLGFMFVEIGLLQRLSVFLGHPIYSLSVVLFSLILSTGIGSLWSSRMAVDSKGRFLLWSVLLGAYLLSLTLWVPGLTHHFEEVSILMKTVLSTAILAPAGILMGFGFPTGMKLVQRIDPAPTPWFWGINGAAGVLASVVAVMISIAYGINATLAMGSVCYLLLIPAAFSIGVPRTVETLEGATSVGTVEAVHRAER